MHRDPASASIVGKQAREGVLGADFKPTGATLVTAVETPEIGGQGNMEEDMDEGQTQKGNGMLFSPIVFHCGVWFWCLSLCLIPSVFSIVSDLVDYTTRLLKASQYGLLFIFRVGKKAFSAIFLIHMFDKFFDAVCTLQCNTY